MNIVKKLKLAFFATSIMLFPKAGHTMDSKDVVEPSEQPSFSLLKFETEDNIEHANSMKDLLSYEGSYHGAYESVKKAAALLDSSSLKERADEFLNLLKASPELKLIADKLSYLAVKLEPVDFRRYVASQKSQVLLINLHYSYSSLEPLMFVDLIKSELTVGAPSSSSNLELKIPSNNSSMPFPVASSSADEPTLQTFNMGKRNDYKTTGFSVFEGTHRWTVGNTATLILPLAKMGHPTSISFLNTGGFVTADHPQKLIVKVNGQEVGTYKYTRTDNNKRIDIDLSTLANVDEAVVEFEMPNAKSPLELETGGDKRALGISFREVEFH